MRLSAGFWCGILNLLAALRPVAVAKVSDEAPPKTDRAPLISAFDAYLEHQGRWAFTETHSGIGRGGKPPVESIIRFDPSRRCAEQYQPSKLSGKVPTEKQLKQWAQHGENAAERREKNAGLRDGDVHLRIFNQEVTPLIEQAVLIAENEASVTYDIPMKKKNGAGEAVFDKFQLTARVTKQRPDFEYVIIDQRSPMRVGAGKFSDARIEIEFASPDAQFPAVPVKTTWLTKNKPLFGKAKLLQSITTRTDLRHVTPYDERAKVNIGAPRTIDF